MKDFVKAEETRHQHAERLIDWSQGCGKNKGYVSFFLIR